MEQQNNVININGTEHNMEDLTQKSRYCIAQIQDLQQKQDSLQFQLDQVAVARQFFVKELEESMKEDKPVEGELLSKVMN